jgi:hypothetical protein
MKKEKLENNIGEGKRKKAKGLPARVRVFFHRLAFVHSVAIITTDL